MFRNAEWLVTMKFVKLNYKVQKKKKIVPHKDNLLYNKPNDLLL